MRVSDASGRLQHTVVARGAALSKEQLDTNDVFIVDSAAEVFGWPGKGATSQARARCCSAV